MAIAYHVHDFLIPTATNEEASNGTVSDKALVPSNLPPILSTKQDLSTALTSIAGLSTSADQTIYTTAENAYATTALTSIGRDVIGGSSAEVILGILGGGTTGIDVFQAETAADIRALLDLEPGTDVQAYSSVLQDIVDGVTPFGDMETSVYDTGNVAGDLFSAQYNILWGGAVGDDTTVNDTNFATIFSAANTGGYELYGPPGTYVVTESIDNFHDVVKRGPWAVRRGTDTFYCNPSEADNQTNRIYVDPAGDDANDGIAADFPVQTMARANAILLEYGRSGALPGTWEVVLAAGTYTGVFSLSSLTNSAFPILIKGPDVGGHPNVPTAIIDLTASPTSTAFSISDYGWLRLQDVKVINATSGGAVSVQRARAGLTNVHTDNVKFPVTSQHGSFTGISGGIFDGNNIADSAGYRGYYGSSHNIGSTSTSLTNADAPLFQNFATGLQIGEGTFGHLDLTRVHDCDVGVYFNRTDAGCNTRLMQIYRCGIGLRAYNSAWMNNGIDFGLGTADACTQALDLRGSSPEFYFRAADDKSFARRYQSGGTSFTHTGTTAATEVWVPMTVPQGYVMSPGDVVVLKIVGTTTGNSGTSSVNVFVDDDFQAGIIVPANTARFEIEATIWFSGATAQRTFVSYNGPTLIAPAYGTGAKNNATEELPIRVQVTNSVSGDTFTANIALCETTVGG